MSLHLQLQSNVQYLTATSVGDVTTHSKYDFWTIASSLLSFVSSSYYCNFSSICHLPTVWPVDYHTQLIKAYVFKEWRNDCQWQSGFWVVCFEYGQVFPLSTKIHSNLCGPISICVPSGLLFATYISLIHILIYSRKEHRNKIEIKKAAEIFQCE